MRLNLSVLIAGLLLAGGGRTSLAQSAAIVEPQAYLELSRELGLEFATTGPSVRLANSALGLTADIRFVDSAFFSLRRDERLTQARRVVQYVRAHEPVFLDVALLVVAWEWRGTDGSLEMYIMPFHFGQLGGSSDSTAP